MPLYEMSTKIKCNLFFFFEFKLDPNNQLAVILSKCTGHTGCQRLYHNFICPKHLNK